MNFDTNNRHMKTYRLGNTITIRWTISLANGEPFTLNPETVELVAIAPHHSMIIDDFTVDSNVLTWIFKGSEQKYLGPYTLTLIQNRGKVDMVTVDICEAFALVPWSCMAGGTDDAAGVETESLEISSTVSATQVTLSPEVEAAIKTATDPKQDKEDPTLQTNDKTIPGAINEIANETAKVQDKGYGDFSLEDGHGNAILTIKDGFIETKNFNSKEIKEAVENIESPDAEFAESIEDDYSVRDKSDNAILAVKDGFVQTKNFDSKAVKQQVQELQKGQALPEWGEKWSKMPILSERPLDRIRFDGGMCRIFRSWGFIGDSLSSGEMYGRTVSYLETTEIQDMALSESGIVEDTSSICTENITIEGYQPKIKLVFSTNESLTNKILVSKFSSESYTSRVTGGSSKEYTVSLKTGDVICISYPKNNVPQIIFQKTYVNDNYELSWGQQIVRLIGASGYNYSVGGEYAKRWCTGEDNQRRWGKAQETPHDVYTIALGVNDMGYWKAGNTSVVDYPCVTAYPNQEQYGSLVLTTEDVMNDVDLSDYNNNANSYSGWYAGIIQRIKTIRKDAMIFCITNPASKNEWNQTIRILVNELNTYYGKPTIWLIDLETYNPINPEIQDNCNLNGHLSAFGYLYSAYQISSYIDWVIRNNIDAFRGTSLIGTNSVVEDFDTFLLN